MDTTTHPTGAAPAGAAPAGAAPVGATAPADAASSAAVAHDELPPVGPLRRALAAFAILMTLPYLGLKIAWLSGATVGLADPEFGRSTGTYVLNALTAGLDVVALALAIVLVTRRGIRAPAWLILPPLWIGAGLLGQILVMTPVGLVAQAVAPEPASEIPPIEGWVFAMVYAGFFGLGIGLLGAFAIYAWQRWGRLAVPGGTPARNRAPAVAAVLVVVATVGHVLFTDVRYDNLLVDLVLGLVTAGALAQLGRSSPGRAAVVVAFVGTGAFAAWGTYLGVVTLVPNDLVVYDATEWSTVAASALRALAGFAGIGAVAVRLRG
ncbi:MAG: hypothetical protein ACTHXO_07860 [Actinomycetaceae bacterium]